MKPSLISRARESVRRARTNRFVGERTIVVFPTEDIQRNLDKLEDRGGGILLLKKGTHSVTADINCRSNVRIYGEGTGKTIINMGVKGFKGTGGVDYTTGTATFTQNSKTITGSSTVWLTNAEVGELITNTNEGNSREYEIASIISDTELTITQDYAEANDSGAAYLIDRHLHDLEFKDFSMNNCSTGFTFLRVRDWKLDTLHLRKGTGDGLSTTVTKRFVVVNCRFEDFDGKGVLITTTSNTDKQIIEDNLCRLNDGDGIELRCQNVVIRGNIFKDNGGLGINVDITGDNNLISENVCTGNTGGSITIDSGGNKNVIANNQFGESITDNGTGNILDSNIVT